MWLRRSKSCTILFRFKKYYYLIFQGKTIFRRNIICVGKHIFTMPGTLEECYVNAGCIFTVISYGYAKSSSGIHG